jgi:ATP-dependent DNA helicase RecG
MSISIEQLEPAAAEQLTQLAEGQFLDVKAKEISPAKLSRTVSAFANSDGGELYIGVGEEHPGGGVRVRKWNGFNDVEAANGHLQLFEKLFPLGSTFQYAFLSCSERSGVVLYVAVNRAAHVVEASDKVPYIRRGAQNLPCSTVQERKRLEYTKGVSSFETQTVNVPSQLISDSPVTAAFLRDVVPSAEAEPWLRKQGLLRDAMPTVAGLILFAEEPQAILPKHCGIKVYRYKTSEKDGFRDALAFTPHTVEGHLYAQVRSAVEYTTKVVESIPRMGESELETFSYPPETLHEIITNALIHRDYSVADDVHIRIFDNRIEVQSPGGLPGHVTVKNILDERFARNGAVVRLLNKFPDPPNKDVGEGLNTAFAKMIDLGLREPRIEERDNDVIVTIRHERLAQPEETILQYLETHESIKNKKAREITHIPTDFRMKSIFGRMVEAGLIEQVPNTRTSSTAYRKKTI